MPDCKHQPGGLNQARQVARHKAVAWKGMFFGKFKVGGGIYAAPTKLAWTRMTHREQIYCDQVEDYREDEAAFEMSIEFVSKIAMGGK